MHQAKVAIQVQSCVKSLNTPSQTTCFVDFLRGSKLTHPLQGRHLNVAFFLQTLVHNFCALFLIPIQGKKNKTENIKFAITFAQATFSNLVHCIHKRTTTPALNLMDSSGLIARMGQGSLLCQKMHQLTFKLFLK